ncbi:unnamed protein product [Adineta steineri]|uniref:4-alpha-glucanotransferase n=4 Tax=Adineta steineri TaxID=433720 RepID=A0A813R956_9BILA|nr:unnamed protein product [Adineta steineri]CAF0827607.1 unnamed protein product [Adineta steineri]
MVKLERTSGILVHICSLPGPNGIGDIGNEAYKFVDFLHECNQKTWQILPLTASEKPSPYSGTSAFAGNPILISLEKLVDDGLLVQTDIECSRPNFGEHIEFRQVFKWKYSILNRAYNNYKINPIKKFQNEIDTFKKNEQYWLDDYTLYMAIKAEQKNQSWSKWPKELKQRDKIVLEEKRQEHADIINEHIFLQYIFFRQWEQLKQYANKYDVTILGDMPVYVDYDSADVWANQSLFQLDKRTSLPKAVSGAPPDAFSETGQLWNNPLYDWRGNLRKTNFDWWIKRLKKCLETVDVVRIDHFRGLEAYWAIPIGTDGKPLSPMKGEWVKACGDEFLTAATKALGDNLPIIAEDLGHLTQEVFDLRDKFGLVGMRVLHFAFAHWPNNMYLPHNYIPNCIAYTGTHDNNTTIGWFRHNMKEKERQTLIDYLQKEGDPERNINWDLIRLVLASVADTAVLLFQDVLDLEEGCQMNDPAFTPDYEENWRWRFQWEQLKQSAKDKLKSLTYIYGRHLPEEALERPDTEAGVDEKTDSIKQPKAY